MTNLDQMIIEMKAADKQRAKHITISNSQLKTLARIREQMLSYCGDRVWKRWDVRVGPGGRLSVSAEVGSPNDEGTMAAVFCRNSWHLFIGRRGGLMALDIDKNQVRGWKAFYAGRLS